jgi:beta-phosphoglucomutase-like phosphatase (HAD superfamily)
VRGTPLSGLAADSAARILEGLGLATAFPVRVTAGQVRRGKPDPEVYLTAAAELGVPPAVCIVFEDAVVGVEAARRAGMTVVGLTTAHTAAELRAAGATWTAPDFTELAWVSLAIPYRDSIACPSGSRPASTRSPISPVGAARAHRRND